MSEFEPSEIIRQEARECQQSSTDERNIPEARVVFSIVVIVQNGVADKLSVQELLK